MANRYNHLKYLLHSVYELSNTAIANKGARKLEP